MRIGGFPKDPRKEKRVICHNLKLENLILWAKKDVKGHNCICPLLVLILHFLYDTYTFFNFSFWLYFILHGFLPGLKHYCHCQQQKLEYD